MNKNWKLKKLADKEQVNKLKKQLNINEFLTNLLIQREIDTFDKAKVFFRPSLDHLHNPFLLKDMDKAIERLEIAIQKNEKILIYGDYDVDGTTSVALVYKFLSGFYENIDFYIPDRYNEGYGISTQGIDYAEENSQSLIIALDCGIKAISQIEYANKKNIDFIICDHHTVGEKIPEAVAVIDAKRPDCEYPYKELSGCGIGFKLAQAYTEKHKLNTENLYNLLELTTISIASDIVPITGENRVLSYFGLKQIQNTKSAGLKALKKIAKIEEGEPLTISDCVFKIGPRINAAGRIKSGKEAVQLLIETDTKKAQEFGQQIDEHNITRKNLDSTITQEALEMIANSPELQSKKTTVVYSSNWHKGVVGIVASRLTENYYRPTIVLTESKGYLTGSARSVEGFNIYDAINSCNHLLESFGGHKYAAGLTMKIENFDKFSEEFEKAVNQTITEEQLVPNINVDAEISLDKITPKFFNIIKQFSPFGPQNMTPIFVSKNVKDTGNSKTVGSDHNHLKVEIMDETENYISGIGFSMGDLYDKIKTGKPFDICYSIEENTFNDKTNLQMFIRDIKLIKHYYFYFRINSKITS